MDLPVSFVVHEFEPNELRMYISKHRYPLSGSRPIETQDPIYLFCGLAITKPCQYKNVLPLDKDPALWNPPLQVTYPLRLQLRGKEKTKKQNSTIKTGPCSRSTSFEPARLVSHTLIIIGTTTKPRALVTLTLKLPGDNTHREREKNPCIKWTHETLSLHMCAKQETGR